VNPFSGLLSGHGAQNYNKFLSQLALLVFMMGYWIFIWRLERVNFNQSPPALWDRFVAIYPLFGFLTERLIVVAELFAPRVLRNLIPVIAGWWLARRTITLFLESFYDLPDKDEAYSLLRRIVASRPPRLPPIMIRPDDFEEDRQTNSSLRIGGPVRVIVNSGNAVVTETNGRFVRVLGSGLHFLERFEYPYAVVDVRPQERASDDVGVITRDGFEVKVEVSVTFQISTGSQAPTRQQPFPFDSDAVRNAAYTQTNLGDGRIGNWDSLPLSVTVGQLQSIVSEYRLDQLVLPESTGIDMHLLLNTEMEKRAINVLRGFGVDVLTTRLGRLVLPEEITEQRIRYWRAYHDLDRRRLETDGDIEAIDKAEMARAEAEAIMLQAVAESLQRARVAGRSIEPKRVVALRLVEALENMAHYSQASMQLPSGMMGTLDDLHQQLQSGSGSSEGPKDE
jgi:regulator of protease activity HflC (stomatin/prohibitin superfamily)